MEAPPPPPPQSQISPTGLRIQRFKPIWRLLLISNLALGAYIFYTARTKTLSMKHSAQNKKKDVKDKKASEEVPLELDPTASALIEDNIGTPLPAPPMVKEPIPEDQQRKLFQWMLEEKRKVKPKDREEKKQNDQEKAILKQFIHSESIPNL